jgi:hypothetical protein
MSREETAFRWRLFAGLAPLLSVGFVASALANRLVFVAWALGAGLCYTVALHRAASLGVPPSGRLVVALTVVAVALVLLGHLVSRHREALDLGFRALVPALYHSWLTHPGTSYGSGATCGLIALVAFLRHKGRAA